MMIGHNPLPTRRLTGGTTQLDGAAGNHQGGRHNA